MDRPQEELIDKEVGPPPFGNELELTLLEGVAEFWNSKAFADLDVVCGVDGKGMSHSSIYSVIIFNTMENKE